MKFTPEDFANRLAGGMDKHEAVEKIKKSLEKDFYKCKITRRQTAQGLKIYFVIEPVFMPDHESYISPWWLTSETTIHKYFPDARLTSGSNTGWTIAEF